jgi:hypothetical protein
MILHTDEVRDSYATFHKDWEAWDATFNIHLPVDVITFDSAIEDFGAPDYCKIDVEGWEYEVLSSLNISIPLVSFEYHLSKRELEMTRKCIDKINGLAPNSIEVNIARPETTDFWRVFPSDFIEKPEFFYGDVWVRSL